MSSYKIIDSYVANASEYLKRKYPNVPDEKRKAILKKICKEHFQNKKATVLDYPAYGHENKKEMSLLKYMKSQEKNILAPSGSTFMVPSRRKSSLRENITAKKAKRKRIKNEGLAADNAGDKIIAALKNSQQLSVKILTNAIYGSLGSKYNFIYDRACSNATTSFGRTCIVLSYTHTERLLQGVYYFPTKDHIINYVMSLIQKMPSNEEINHAINKAGLRIPTVDDLSQMINYSYQKYNKCDCILDSFLNTLTDTERAYVFYAGNLKSLFQGNDGFFRDFVEKLFPEYGKLSIDGIEPEDIYKLDEDLLIMISGIYFDSFNGVYFYDLPKKEKENAEVNRVNAKHVIAIAKYMQDKLNSIKDIFDLFINVESELPSIRECKDIHRECVVGSDTDSVIFTTKDWVKWFTGDLIVNQRAYQINALMTFYLTKSIIKVLDIMCRNRNIAEEDIPRLYMKNEFLYISFVRASIKKTYFGFIAIREGRRLPEPKLDVKGLQLKSSTICPTTHVFTDTLMEEVLHDIADKGNVNVTDHILTVIDFEQTIKESTERGLLEYIGIESIKTSESYKDAESTIYFNYLVWEELYGDKYGHILPPEKVNVLPLKKLKVKQIEKVFTGSPDLVKKGKKLHALMVENGKKEITRLPISNDLQTIPKELIPFVDVRAVINKNTAGSKYILNPLGVTLPMKKEKEKDTLFSDIYMKYI